MKSRIIGAACAVLAWLCALLGRVRIITTPDGKQLYLERFALWGSVNDDPGFWGVNVWLHRIHLPDADRATHNHPWFWARARILTGGYYERRTRRLFNGHACQLDSLFFWRSPGDSYLLTPSTYHRIDYVSPGTWTLFVTGRTTLEGWGFLTPAGHVDSKQYLRTLGDKGES
jgi:hypothetical protein